MLGIICIGDKSTHGDTLQSCSSEMIFGGIDVARKGDIVSCSVEGHDLTSIVEGLPTIWTTVFHFHFMVISVAAAFRLLRHYRMCWSDNY